MDDPVHAACIQALLAGVQELVPGDDSLVSNKKEKLQACQHKDTGEYQTKVCLGLWRRLKHRGDGEVRWATPLELARDVAAHVEVAAPLAAVHARGKGLLVVSSARFVEWQRRQEKLLCPDCGEFFAERRGLRHHQQIKHKTAYADAKGVEHAAKQQLIVHPKAPGIREQLQDALLREARGAAPDTRHKKRPAPWIAACQAGDEDRLRGLYGDGAWTAQTCDKHGSTALHWAAGGGHLALCRWLVRGDWDAAAPGIPADVAQEKDGRMPLHWAARNGHVHICRYATSISTLRQSPDA